MIRKSILLSGVYSQHGEHNTPALLDSSKHLDIRYYSTRSTVYLLSLQSTTLNDEKKIGNDIDIDRFPVKQLECNRLAQRLN